MASQNVKITCYMYRDSGSKVWSIDTGDLSLCRASCVEPEDAVRRGLSLILEKYSQEVMNSSFNLSTNLKLEIDVQIVTEEEFTKLINKQKYNYDTDASF